MSLSRGPAPLLIEDFSLEGWEVIGSGGFGQIYKARHRQWCRDVAIKLLYNDDGKSKSLLREVDMMRRGSSPNIIQVLGVFKGRLTSSGPTQLGLVMELMERGSLASLQMTLREIQPWPLVFRLAHQVALGINFLHSLSPPLLHLDLKPNNVLLDSDLNAKLTDFGLARFYHSVTRVSKKDSEEEGGTINYMPPEAFDLSYKPTKASDIYSYGILLWSIVTGKQPYANAMSSIVRFRIPQGDRPSLDEIRSIASGRSGLTRLMDLMQNCWKPKSNERPTSLECTIETEELYKMHKRTIHDVVSEVLKKLDQREEEGLLGQFHLVHITQDSVQDSHQEVNVPTGRPPVQEMGHSWPADEGIKTRLEDPPSFQPTRLCETDKVRTSRDYEVKVSSVHPVQSSPSPGTSAKGKTATTSQQGFRKNLIPQYQRQYSSPSGGVHIHCSNIIGLQHGDHNHMYIDNVALDRKRHPTAPSSVNLPMPHP